MPARILFAAAMLTLGACSPGGRAPQVVGAASPNEIPVKTATASLETMPVEIQTIGAVEALSTVSVKAQAGGLLVKIYFAEGQPVREGDPLFEIDPRPYQQAVRQWEANLSRDRALLAQSEANLARAEAREAHARMQHERYVQLAAEGVVSREQADAQSIDARSRHIDVAAERAAIESAQASIRSAEASLDLAKLNLGYCSIRSPITGRTGALLIKQGNIIKANESDLVTIHQIQPSYVSFAVPEDQLATLRARMRNGAFTVTAAIPGDTGTAASGSVTFLNNTVDAGTGTIRLKATFANQDGKLWPGQFVDVRVLVDERRGTVVIPAGALQTGQSGSYVYIVKGDDTVELRTVTLGPRNGRLASIASGLAAGERVVTEGQLRLAPGVRVRTLS